MVLLSFRRPVREPSMRDHPSLGGGGGRTPAAPAALVDFISAEMNFLLRFVPLFIRLNLCGTGPVVFSRGCSLAHIPILEVKKGGVLVESCYSRPLRSRCHLRDEVQLVFSSFKAMADPFLTMTKATLIMCSEGSCSTGCNPPRHHTAKTQK